jgi:small subunit ribosomal protein S5
VLEAAGIRDILSKSQGSANILNVSHATLDALRDLKDAKELAAMRGKDPAALQPFWKREGKRNE